MNDSEPRQDPEVIEIATRLDTLAEKLTDPEEINLLHVAAEKLRRLALDFVPGRKTSPNPIS